MINQSIDRSTESSTSTTECRHQQKPTAHSAHHHHPYARPLAATLGGGGGGGSNSNNNNNNKNKNNNNNNNGDFDPDPLEAGEGAAPPPASDMLARIFQGAQDRRASSGGSGGDWARCVTLFFSCGEGIDT